ncbi:unnamed protein product [Durusdinium trenchii]
MLTRIRESDMAKSEASSPSTPPLEKPGSAYAERSAFKKAYARKMLPLVGEKPILDFSAYKGAYQTNVKATDGFSLALAQAEAPRRIYAGLELPGVRGLKHHEADRWRQGIGAGFQLDRVKDEDEKSDPLRDPWGCALAGKQPLDEEEKVDEEEERSPQPKRRPAPPVKPRPPVSPTTPVSPPVKAPPVCAKTAPRPKARPVPPGQPEQLLAKARPGSQEADDCVPGPGAVKVEPEPPGLVKAKAMPRKPEGANGANGPPEEEAGEIGDRQMSLADLPRLLEEGQAKAEDEEVEEAKPKVDAKVKVPAAALPPIRKLMGLEDARLSEVQMELVKELAGGSKFHDPARDPSAYRKQAQNMCLIEVSQLKFCHKDIGPRFTHGKHRGQPVLKLLEDLHARRIDAQELAPLVVMRNKGGLQVVCGNRRLYCLKRYALEASRTVDAWCVVYDLKAKDTPRPLVFKYILATTTEDANTVSARSF